MPLGSGSVPASKLAMISSVYDISSDVHRPVRWFGARSGSEKSSTERFRSRPDEGRRMHAEFRVLSSDIVKGNR